MPDIQQRHPVRMARMGLPLPLLGLPALAMLFTDEVRWGPEDFAVAAVLLLGLGGLLELGLRTRRLGAVVQGLTGLGLTWANLAVGLFGEPGNLVNLVALLASSAAVLVLFAPERARPAASQICAGGLLGAAVASPLLVGVDLPGVLLSCVGAAVFALFQGR